MTSHRLTAACIFLVLPACSSMSLPQRKPQGEPLKLLEILPGQIDENECAVGAKEPVRAKGSFPFGKRYLATSLKKLDDGTCEAVSYSSMPIKNCDIFAEDAFQNDDILIERDLNSEDPMTVVSYKIIPKKSRILPIFWCASEPRTETELLNRSYFISLEETEWIRESAIDPMSSSKGNAHVYVFEHPKSIAGNERFNVQYLKFEKLIPWITQEGASELSGLLAYGMDFQNEKGDTGSLQRVNQTVKLTFKTQEFEFSLRRLSHVPSSKELLCVGVGSHFRP